MSTTQGAFGQDGFGGGANQDGASPWRRSGRWSAFEIVAMVLGFIVFWPIGLAVLGYIYWSRKTGGRDLQTAAAGAFRSARSAVDGFQASRGSWRQPTWTSTNWARGFTASTGNAAFDQWKSAELSRLEEERRKLEDAHREFADWLENIRKSKDREEFERFMNDRRQKGV